MKFDIKPERYNEFKKYMAKKLTAETGRTYFPEDIYIGEKDSDGHFIPYKRTKEDHYKYIFGDVDFRDYDSKTLNGIEFIFGNVKFRSLKLKTIPELSTGGRFRHYELKIRDLDELQFIGGDADFSRSGVTDLGKLEHVGGDLNLVDSHVNNIDSLKYVGGKLFLGAIQKLYFQNKIYVKDGSFYFKNDPQYMKEKNIVEDNESQL